MQQAPPANEGNPKHWYLGVIPLIIACTIINLVSLDGIHVIDEGYIGLYTQGGKLLPKTSEAGISYMIPLITRVHQVQVTLQSDFMTNIPCGTSSGVMATFGKVQVVNRLRRELAWQTVKNYSFNYDKLWIYDRIHHEINQFCSKHSLIDVYLGKFDELENDLQNALQSSCDQHAPGIEVIKVIITKPIIPEHLVQKFEQTEAQRVQLSIVKLEQLVEEKKRETDKLVALLNADAQRNCSLIRMEESILRKSGEKQLSEIENHIKSNHSSTLTAINHYHTSQQTEINKQKLTPEYQLYQATNLLNNAEKIFFGNTYEQFYVENQGILY